MPTFKMVSGTLVEMSPAEEAAFNASRAIPLAEWKRRLTRMVAERRRAVEEGGIAVGQQQIETTREFRSQLRELREWAVDNPGQQIPVRLANGRIVRVSAAQMAAAAQAIIAHVKACMDAEADHLDAVDALATVAQAEAYDVTTGWPA